MNAPTVVLEGKFKFAFGGARTACIFDEHCRSSMIDNELMKAVDIFVDFNNSYWFVEVKDKGADSSIKGLIKDLKYKFRDSLLYRFAEGNVDANKHFHYICLIPQYNDEMCANIRKRLVAGIPVHSRRDPLPRGWVRPLARSCQVVNWKGWQEKFSKRWNWHVTRLP